MAKQLDEQNGPVGQKGHLLENEDEFEEFEVDEWNMAQQDLNDDELWEQEWDDDAVGRDDFSQRLKAELNRNHAMS